jgi:hypothetical protein
MALIAWFVATRILATASANGGVVVRLWFGGYLGFVVFGTGPADVSSYPPAGSSPYKLPWHA